MSTKLYCLSVINEFFGFQGRRMIQVGLNDLPGFKFHALKGGLIGEFAVSFTGNWRIRFESNHNGASNFNLEDYHWWRLCEILSASLPKEVPYFFKIFCLNWVWRKVSLLHDPWLVDRQCLTYCTVKKSVTSQMANLIARGVCGTLENWLRMQEALNFWSDEIKFNINFKAV